MLGKRDLQALFPVPGLDDIQAFLFEREHRNIPQGRLVLYDQDLVFFHSYCLLADISRYYHNSRRNERFDRRMYCR